MPSNSNGRVLIPGLDHFLSVDGDWLKTPGYSELGMVRVGCKSTRKNKIVGESEDQRGIHGNGHDLAL